MFNLNIMYQEKIIKKESLLKLMISMLLKYLEMIKNKPTLKNPEQVMNNFLPNKYINNYFKIKCN